MSLGEPHFVPEMLLNLFHILLSLEYPCFSWSKYVESSCQHPFLLDDEHDMLRRLIMCVLHCGVRGLGSARSHLLIFGSKQDCVG